MAGYRFGRTLVIANPAAQSGRGAQGAQIVEETLARGEVEVDGYEVRRTAAAGDATWIAREAAGFDTVVALGGDGVIHETVNGLMAIDAARRPCLAVIPLGSGNDFARTVGAPRNQPDEALRRAAGGTRTRFDLGLVNGVHFMETLSFGLDAAIALDTYQRRTKNGAHGTRLFAASGFEIFSRHRDPYPYRGLVWTEEDAEPREIAGEEVVFAVQVGPTYGGGFRICPDASPTDGLLSLCRSVAVPSVPHALALFVRARFGLHTGSPALEFSRLARLTLDFEREPPCQVDGERLTGTHYEISSVPGALDVVVCR